MCVCVCVCVCACDRGEGREWEAACGVYSVDGECPTAQHSTALHKPTDARPCLPLHRGVLDLVGWRADCCWAMDATGMTVREMMPYRVRCTNSICFSPAGACACVCACVSPYVTKKLVSVLTPSHRIAWLVGSWVVG
jgi:hypothetical protein